MRKILLPVAAAVLILSSLAATPAHACCAEDIEKIEKRMWKMADMAPLRVLVLGKIAFAKDHLEKGREKKCIKFVKMADKLLTNHGM